VNAGGEQPEHRLGPIAFDRSSRRFSARCQCGQRFGPMSTAGMVHAAFEAHRCEPGTNGSSSAGAAPHE